MRLSVLDGAGLRLKLNRKKELDIVSTTIAINLLLNIDLWEHAYFIDYRNARGIFQEAWWNVCWERNLESPSVWRHQSKRKS